MCPRWAAAAAAAACACVDPAGCLACCRACTSICRPAASPPAPASSTQKPPLPARPLAQTATEVFFRKARFWGEDGKEGQQGKDAPPAFHVDGVQYLHVKVGGRGLGPAAAVAALYWRCRCRRCRCRCCRRCC